MKTKGAIVRVVLEPVLSCLYVCKVSTSRVRWVDICSCWGGTVVNNSFLRSVISCDMDPADVFSFDTSASSGKREGCTSRFAGSPVVSGWWNTSIGILPINLNPRLIVATHSVGFGFPGVGVGGGDFLSFRGGGS
jgi:hypothetical protein